jgi:hypothetical protein
MSISNYNDYKELIGNARQRTNDTKVATTVVSGRTYSLWRTLPDQGELPAAAVTCSNLTPGAMVVTDSDYNQYLTQISISLGASGMITIADRLCHNGGLSGTVIGEQTTNFPTSPLPRYTDGKGVFISADIYTAVGATSVLMSASYTNQDGISGSITQPVLFGATGFNAIARSIILPLQQGDTGVRSVESVNLSASTGTIGNWGITLFKPLINMNIYDIGPQLYLFDSILSLSGNFAKIENGACLYYRFISPTTSTGIIMANNRFIEDQT